MIEETRPPSTMLSLASIFMNPANLCAPWTSGLSLSVLADVSYYELDHVSTVPVSVVAGLPLPTGQSNIFEMDQYL